MTERRSDRRGEQPRPRRRSGAAPAANRSTTQRRSPRPTSARTEGRRPRPATSSARRGAPGRGGRILRNLLLFIVLVAVAVGVTGCAVYSSMSSQLPDPDITKARGRDQSTVITDRKGKTLVRLYAEQNRQDVALSEIPVQMRQAVIATEDQRFYEHKGVDPMGILRAVVTDVRKGEKAQGGSTITQQYVKQAFVTSEKTLKRKLQEAILAQKVERRYSKDEILGMYLNTIYYGHSAYGIESASRAYFGKGIKDVTLAEAAMLAGVIKSPGRYSPYLDPKAALQRRNTVLKQMLSEGYIDEAAYQEARDTPIKVAGLKPPSARAPYFVEWVKETLVEEYGERAVYRGGLHVRTTLDPAAQSAAEKAVAGVLDKQGDPSAALVAINPKTGAVIAMVGGKDFKKQQFNVAVQGRRQPGSAFKPFVLATALSEGVSPEKGFEAGPRSFNITGTGQVWKVTGAGGGRKGPMRLREATEKSVNSVYAQLILDVGADKVVEMAEKLGIRKGIEPMPAIALGGLKHGVSPLEMASAYGTLAAGGVRATPYGIAEVTAGKKVLRKTKPELEEAIDPDIAYLTTDILTGVIKRGTGKSADIGRPAAGKTGTTQEYRDAWFVGYTPDLVSAVWVGYPESQREMTSVHGRQVTGGSFPAEIWARFMSSALGDRQKAQFEQPSGLTRVTVCAETGGLVTQFCPKKVSALVLESHKPALCTLHKVPVEVKVPNVVGKTKLDALTQIESLTLKAAVVERDVPGVAAGIVASQTPAPGKVVKANSVVSIVVSTGGGSNKPPVAAFSGPASGKTGESLTFDATPSSDDGAIKTYYWEFGDGATASGKKASHAWSGPGTYEVTLWVTDDRGAQGSVTKSISIK